MREDSPGKGKWQNSCKSAGSGKITGVAASHRLQQGEEQQLPNSPTREGGGGAWFPVAAEGAARTVVSRERREQEERSGAERNPRSISSRIPPGVAGVWEVSAGASSGVRTLPERKRLPVGIISRHS